MIKLSRKIKLDDTGLRVNLERDFINYYIWMIRRYYWNCIKINAPKHGAHISIITKKLHKEFNKNKLQKYHNKMVDFWYDPAIRMGGSYFTNFWLFVDLPIGEKIKNELGIVEKGFLGYHITIGSDKYIINNKT